MYTPATCSTRRRVVRRTTHVHAATPMTGLGFDLNPVHWAEKGIDAVLDVAEDLPVVGSAVKFVERVGTKTRRKLAKAAREVGLGPVIDKLEQWGGEAAEWYGEEVESVLKDPATWAIVGGVVLSGLTGGAAAPLVAATAASALTARTAPRVVAHATRDLTKKVGKEAGAAYDAAVRNKSKKHVDKVNSAVRDYNPTAFDKRQKQLTDALMNSPEFKKKVHDANLKAASTLIDNRRADVGISDVERALRKDAVEVAATALDDGKTPDEAVGAAKAKVTARRAEVTATARAGAARYDKPEQRARFVTAYLKAALVDGKTNDELTKAARRSASFPSKTAPTGPFYARELARQQKAQAALTPKTATPKTATPTGNVSAFVVVGLAAVVAVGYVVHKQRARAK